ncbi:hypothetical protein [Actinomadura craniellae]|uniref:hypothetical protein n=1 Tax=Actinomadura craniellae TaxID=2231787 RepID=UPI0013144531|nr:hypothetical protein [Actinomadura craniellae]
MSDVLLFTISMGVTVLGLAVSWAAYRRRGAASALRGAGWSLVPAGAYFTGFTEFAANLVLNPLKWAGVGVLALAGVLYVVSGVMLRRGAVDPAPGPKRAAGGGRKAVEHRAATPAVDPDLADIEEILRRRGIS